MVHRRATFLCSRRKIITQIATGRVRIGNNLYYIRIRIQYFLKFNLRILSWTMIWLLMIRIQHLQEALFPDPILDIDEQDAVVFKKIEFIIYEKKISTNVKISYEQYCGAGFEGSVITLPPGAGFKNSKLRIRIRKSGIRLRGAGSRAKRNMTDGSATLVLRFFTHFFIFGGNNKT